MKKFLSLVLAMIMTMSLVTISAGATEYKDLTDKDEIQYEEAVAVLNRIGVITGYEDGSFRPETELTRGAAAKIIVSLMIGPDAASALPNTTSPYPDVPAGHTFAGVISYCKTAGYISGYGDGTFKPAGTLTGYAFAKMLLGAVGYDSDIERFTGTGWTMNVAKIGNVAGLFDRISFDGAAAVNRDQACQLALNTLKATLVTYGGTSIINGSTGSYTIQGTDAKPITSNNRDINANIGRKDWYGGNNQNSDYLTLEFGEEHFKDLRLEHDRFDPANDDFGRPSNEWSYKKVTIGTFPLEPDFSYTTQVAHLRDTDGTKEKALGLRNYDLVADGGYSIWTGWGSTGNTSTSATNSRRTALWLNGVYSGDLAQNDSKIAQIADYTDNGTLVEVYVSDIDADWITDVVVIQTQLMEIKKIGSDYVSLDRITPDTDAGENSVGFNQPAIHAAVEQVKDTNEDPYNVLSGLKTGDNVAIIPVSTDGGSTWEVAEAYVPETITGTLTRVDTYGYGKDDDDERGAISITVGGTEYKISDWNKDMWDIKAEAIKATRKDVTLLMDKYGNALRANDVGSTNNFMVIGDFYQALSGNKICTFVHGWDIGGEEIDLNLGSSVKVHEHDKGGKAVNDHVIGELVYYTSAGATGDADYILDHANGDYSKAVFDVYTNTDKANKTTDNDTDASYEIKAANVTVPLADKKTSGAWQDGTYSDETPANKPTHSGYAGIERHTYYYDKGVVFIYVNYDGEDEVESVEFKKGVQNVSYDELRTGIMGWAAQAAVKDQKVQAVVIKTDSSDASVNRMLYVTDTKGWKEVDKETGEKGFEIEAAMFHADGSFTTEEHIIVNKDLQIGDFATYTQASSSKYTENYYRVKQFTRHNTNPAVLTTIGASKVTDNGETVKHLVRIGAAYAIDAKLIDANKLLVQDDGTVVANANYSYLLGGYRGAGTDLFDEAAKARGVINTAKAEWLDATASQKYDDVDSAEDLFKLADKGVDLSKIELDILLNEKPDSDGFRTAYLVVIKNVDVSNSGGGASGTSTNTKFDVTRAPSLDSGNLAMSIDVTRPAFADRNATVQMPYQIKIDGATVETGNKTLAIGTNRVTFSGLNIQSNENWEVILNPTGGDLVWSKVYVKYSINGTGVEYNDAKFQTAGPETVASVGNAAAPTAIGTIVVKSGVGFYDAGVNGKMLISGTTTDATFNGAGGTTGKVVTPGQNLNTSASGTYTVTANGTDYVKIDISGLQAPATQYTVANTTFASADIKDIIADDKKTADMTDAGDGDVKINVEPLTNGTVNEGTPLDLKVWASAAIAEVAALDVTVKVNGTSVGTVRLTATEISKAAGKTIHTTVTEDIDVSSDVTLEVVPVEFLKVMSVTTTSPLSYKVTFNRAPAQATCAATDENTTTGDRATYTLESISGLDAYFTADKATTVDDGTMSFATTVVDADGIGLSDKTVFTVDASGVWSVQ